MERIAPSEQGAITVTKSPDNGYTMLVWNILPPALWNFQCVVAITRKAFYALISLGREGDDPSLDSPIPVATVIHTDDEIARKILVFGAQRLSDFRAAAIDVGMYDLARDASEFQVLIQDGLESWGAGSDAAYVRPSPKLAQRVPPEPRSSNRPPILEERQTGSSEDLEEVRAAKLKTSGWVVVNVLMVLVAALVSIATYAGADPGGTFIIWWGPVVWGVVNLVRFGSRLSRLNRIEEEILAFDKDSLRDLPG